MTRVVALGGCGGIGQHAVQTLLEAVPECTVVVADRSADRAAALAARLGPRAAALALDVEDAPALRDTLQSADLVLNAVGPYFRFGVPVLRACIDAGCHYLDVCDDWEPTLAMLELDQAARDAGVTAGIGLGISPGVSNLLAAVAVQALDEAVEVITGWDLASARPAEIGPEPSAATLHGIQQLTGRIRVRRGGHFVEERPMRRVRVDYPGLGVRTGWTIGHPEPVTLPRTFPSLRDSLNVFTASRRDILGMRVLRGLVDGRLVTPDRAARWVEAIEGTGGQTPQVTSVLERAGAAGRLERPPIFACARGRRAGQPAGVGVTLLSAPPGGMGGVTGVPLGVAAAMHAQGRLARPGVHAPEALLDPTAFFDRLAPRCDPPRADAADLLLVTRSWESGTLRQGYAAGVGAR